MPRRKTVSYEELSDLEEFENLSFGSREDQDTDDILTDDLLQSTSSEEDKKKKKKTQKKKTLTKRKTTKKETKKTKAKVVVKRGPEGWKAERVRSLRETYPDPYWSFHAESSDMIHTINEDHPLEGIPCTINDQAPITSMALSRDGSLLATFSNIGAIKLWDVENDFALVHKLRDGAEANIDEFYCGKFVGDEHMVVGGKLKDRQRWSAEDDDNHILPCPIKIFNVPESKVVAKLEGHTEEILCIKALEFEGENYYISTSQDGSIMKWHMASDWITLLDRTKMDDNITCMAFTVSFVPNTGNKYFMAAVDEHLRLYDFENAQLLQTFSDLYSSYCDCGKFVRWLDESLYLKQAEKNKEEEGQYAWFISRGAELCDVSEGVSSKPNTCTLHKLVYPTKDGEQFRLEQVKKYQNEDYHSNSWLVKITSNGRYLLAPTIYGQIFVFNMLTEQVTAILKEHQDMEVRDVIFHPYRPLLFSCGDDGCVKVYTYPDNDNSHSQNMHEDVEQDLDVVVPDQMRKVGSWIDEWDAKATPPSTDSDRVKRVYKPDEIDSIYSIRAIYRPQVPHEKENTTVERRVPKERKVKGTHTKPIYIQREESVYSTRVHQEHKPHEIDVQPKKVQRKAVLSQYKIRKEKATVERSCSTRSLSSTHPLHRSPASTTTIARSLSFKLETRQDALQRVSRPLMDSGGPQRSLSLFHGPSTPSLLRTTTLSSTPSVRWIKASLAKEEKPKQRYIRRTFEEMMRIPDIFERLSFYEKTLDACLAVESPIARWIKFMSTRGKLLALEEGHVPVPRPKPRPECPSYGSSLFFTGSLSHIWRKATGSQAFPLRDNPTENTPSRLPSASGSGLKRSVSILGAFGTHRTTHRQDRPKSIRHRANSVHRRPIERSLISVIHSSFIKSSPSRTFKPDAFKDISKKHLSKLNYMVTVLPHEDVGGILEAFEEANGDTVHAISIVMNKKQHAGI
ncbi:hypothetical protein G6F43_004683 [Rhizopus delemar]|nr:hypothetical protein G6F43_004683 [Rhizopus delemar]